MKAKISFKKDNIISKIDDRIYSSFIEQLGRAVYTGIYEPGHKEADDLGFRKDVMKVIRDLKCPMVRYPGGNFVSGYNWEDGTGPKDKRPKKLELAWGVIETNQVGIDDFQEWAKRAGTSVMMAVNLGTRGPVEAGNLVEYCNLDTDTYFANKRRENGYDKPFNIKTWCLGNEMDGPWQIGAKTPVEYARIAHEAGKIMKWTDPSIELVACGSSSPTMPTFGEWEKTVLREAYDEVDYVSLHSYYRNDENNIRKFLASSLVMDKFIEDVIKICDDVKEELHKEKTVNLSFDEWNVWFHSNEQDKKIERWSIAPAQLEDIYDFSDALVVGSLMITLLKHADRVKIACLAQLVNVIAPIMTVPGGGLWLQTIFYPFYYTCVNGRGTALVTEVSSEKMDIDEFKDVNLIDSVVVLSEDEKKAYMFAFNRSIDSDCTLDISHEGFGTMKAVRQVKLSGYDFTLTNSAEHPDNVKAVTCDLKDGEDIVLDKASWNMIEFTI